MLTDAAYMPSVEEIAAYGLDETGLINKYRSVPTSEQERGPGYVAQQILNEFGYGYGFVRKSEYRRD